MKKAVVFGGCGEIGKWVVRDLLEYSDFAPIVIGDIREERAKAFIKELNTTRVTFQKVDAHDQQSLISALEGATIAINTIGPFFEFALLVANAVYQAGVNYVDVCDDPDATVNLLSLDEMVKRKGLTLLICQGWTPGVTNMMAKKGAMQMDKVRSLRVVWVQDLEEEIGIAPIMHWGHVVVGKIPTYRDRKWVLVPGLSEREEVRLPDPIGVVAVYHAGHPEPVTLPRYIDAELVSCKGGLVPHSAVTLTRVVRATGIGNTTEGLRFVAKTFIPLLPLISKVGGKTSGWSGSRVEILGEKDGKLKSLVYGVKMRVGETTGRSASIGAQMVASGEITEKGVMPPEGCVDPDRFFAEFTKRGLTLIEMD